MRPIIIICVIFCSSLVALSQHVASPQPEVVRSLSDSTERSNYQALHYWEDYNFADTALIAHQAVSEQAFSDFIRIMPRVTLKSEAFAHLVDGLMSNEAMLDFFLDMAQKHLAEPHSPLYDEELYILMLDAVLSSQQLDDTKRLRVQYHFDMAMKNRIGEVAADITMLLRDGSYTTLHAIHSNKYILLYMGDPDCNVCTLAKNKLRASPHVARLIELDELVVVSLCVEGKTDVWLETPAPCGWVDACDENQVIYEEETYDMATLPSFYLLDSEHKVILRDVHVEHLLDYLAAEH